MISISPSLILVAALLTVPVASAVAQNNPAGNYGSNRSATAAPITGDKPGTGLSTADVDAKHKATTRKVRPVSATPGGTGRTVVPGNHSTVAGDSSATAKAQTGSIGGGSK